MENSKREQKNIKLSASTISDYISCPRKVYYRYYRPDLEIKSEALKLGSLVHDTLEKHSNNFMDAMKYISMSEENDIIREKAADMVSKYFKYFTDVVDKDDKVEEYINFKVNDYPFVAKIDRHNKYRIIDWKTSRKSKGNGIDTDIQSIIYAEAFRYKYGNYPEQILFVNLRNVDISHAKINSKFRKYFMEEIIPYVYEGIKENRFPALGRFNWQSPCKYCQYKNACIEDTSE